jgi:sedoheptulose-bisphosphatase
MLGQTGRDQLASCMAVYGPRTHLAVALNSQVTGSQAVSFDLTFHPHQKTWMISRERLRVQPSGRIFAPGNLRATQDLPRYKSLFDHWLENKYTLRYSGGMVGDVYHILIKEKGVFTNVPSTSAKAKLRLVFECAPIALLVEAAGGASLVSPDPLQQSAQVARSVLDVRIDDMDQRLGVCYGGTEEIEICKKHLFG